MEDNVKNRRNLRDAVEAGCETLTTGWARKKETNESVHAFNVTKADGPFYCPGCYSDVVHRRCTEIKDHFAHKAPLSPIASDGESNLHYECKTEIFKDLRLKLPEYKWVCDDVRIKEDSENKLCALQPDIGGRIGNRRVAIEVQNSSLTVPKLLKRTLSYSARGISILWVVPLKEKFEEQNFRPRLFERYLHSMYFGRVYYWLPDYGGKVIPVHFGLAWREIPVSSWYEEGELVEVGGYKRPYKRLRIPMPKPPISIASDFQHHYRREHTPWNERKAVPPMRLLRDNLKVWWKPNEDKILNKWYSEEEPEENGC